MIDTIQVKSNEKICEIKKNNPKTIFITKSFDKMDFENSFNGSRIVLRDYIEKSILIEGGVSYDRIYKNTERN